MNIGRIKLRYSGGATNTTPANSIGGAMSTETEAAGGVIHSQTNDAVIAGVTIDDTINSNTAADGTLKLFRTPVAQIQNLTTDAELQTMILR